MPRARRRRLARQRRKDRRAARVIRRFVELMTPCLQSHLIETANIIDALFPRILFYEPHLGGGAMEGRPSMASRKR